MIRLFRKSLKFYSKQNKTKFRTISNQIQMSEEVKFGMERCKPVVALESTIITHGMPFPDNINCALDVENIIREQGAIPATIAIIGGKMKVGLTNEEISKIGDTKTFKSIKTSRRDLPYVVSQKLNGGTTVSGTMIIAEKAGIPIFVTGGIGGVHREAEQTFDVSADLTELGKTPVAVISSGVKSILDIQRTLEYLETQGVFVATFGSSTDFPAFYSRNSSCQAPYCISSTRDAAMLIKALSDFNLRSGMLIAVPVPEEHAFDEESLNLAIEDAIAKAKRAGITGKKVTPYLLKEIANITKGRSLESNIALIKNNAKIGAQIAVDLQKLKDNRKVQITDENRNKINKMSPVIIGGSNIDCCASLLHPELTLDGGMNNVKYTISAGGVARNICEALTKLGVNATFLSAIGNDHYGEYLQSLLPSEVTNNIQIIPDMPTAQCTVVHDSKGNCKMLIGEMDIHKQISPELIKSREELLKQSPLLVTDGNLPIETLSCVLEIAQKHAIPVFHETTDVIIAENPFRTPYWKSVKFMSPNLNELKQIAKYLKISIPNDTSDPISEARELGKIIGQQIDNLIITLGHLGIVIIRKVDADEPLLIKKLNKNSDNVQIRYYKTKENTSLVNVNGAGDCLTSGIIAAMLMGLPEANCVSVGFAAANLALQSSSAIPKSLFNDKHSSWKQAAPYEEL